MEITLKEFLVETVSGPSKLLAWNLQEAKSEVRWEFANCGKIKLIERTYKLESEKIHEINTDY